MNEHQNKMGVKSIPYLLITMSLPAMLSMMIQALYNVADSIFVSQISEESLSAVSLAFPIQLVIIAAFVGMGIGINSLISRKLGAGEFDDASNAAEHGFLVSIILTVLLFILGLFIVRPYFMSFTSDVRIIEEGVTYLTIIMLFSFGRMIGKAAASTLQGTGQMIIPMIAQAFGALLNIFLDWVLIFGKFGLPAMGVKGAAIATVLAQIVSMVILLVALFTRHNTLSLNLKKFKFDGQVLKQIVLVGLPAAIMQSLASVMLAGLNFIVGSFTETAIAVLGVYYRLQSFVFMPVFGLGQGLMPLIGFSYGAKNKKRLLDAMKLAAAIALVLMILGMLAFQFFSPQMLSWFKADQEMLDIGVHAFKVISLVFPMAAISIVISTSFQGMGKAHYSLIVSFIRMIVVLLPASYLLSLQWGLDATWYAFIISEVVGLIVVFYFFAKSYRSMEKDWQVDE